MVVGAGVVVVVVGAGVVVVVGAAVVVVGASVHGSSSNPKPSIKYYKLRGGQCFKGLHTDYIIHKSKCPFADN